MSKECERIQAALTEGGREALKDDAAAQAHLAECDECFAFLEALALVDETMKQLPAHDAADALVNRTLSEVSAPARVVTSKRGSVRPRNGWKLGAQLVASAVAMLLCVVGVTVLTMQAKNAPDREAQPSALIDLSDGGAPDSPLIARYSGGGKHKDEGERLAHQLPKEDDRPSAPRPDAVNDGPRSGEVKHGFLKDVAGAERSEGSGGLDQRKADSSDDHAAQPSTPQGHAEIVVSYPDQGKKKVPVVVNEQQSQPQPSTRNNTSPSNASPSSPSPNTPIAAQEKLALTGSLADGNEGLDGLRFQEARGYWANTYLPGDPEMRSLALTLAQKNGPHEAVRRVVQPFDAPTAAALALYVSADTRSVTQPTRMLVQVGIKAAERHSRARPAMNATVVLDLRTPPSDEEKASIRALVEALGSQKAAGDKFSLVIAGAPGGVIVPAASFKRGPLLVALQQTLDGVGTAPGATLSLQEAMETAVATTLGGDDPNAPLGSSVVLLVTSGAISGSLPQLEQLAHASATNGVPVSVIGLGGADMDLDALALSGQGNRRSLTNPSAAQTIIDEELSAVSRVVARALRLRIRLAPNVKLVDVLGSHRLSAARTEAVRQQEQSIDRRLAKNLGIEADRGEDEDGIQIVIPAFYAGDTHVVLLDVVAGGPGAIADVRVRYKDLVYLKNGEANARFAVARTQMAPGPLEVNVTKNRLAFLTSQAFASAGRALAANDRAGALRELSGIETLLRGALAADHDVAADLELIADYRAAIQRDPTAFVADSLKYSGFVKLRGRTP